MRKEVSCPKIWDNWNCILLTVRVIWLNGLAEAAATELSRRENPKGFQQNAGVAQRGGDVAYVARERLEQELGETVISDKRAVDFIIPPEELPFNAADSRDKESDEKEIREKE